MTAKTNRARERSAAFRRAEQARQRRRRLLAIGAAVAALLVVAGIIIAVVLTRSGSRGSLTGVQTYVEKAGHVQGTVNYPQTPPAGGPHNQVVLNCGVYTQPVANENAVHSLEHGAVWITYRPGLPAVQLGRLRDLVRAQSYLVLSPYPGLPAPVVASAWGKQLTLKDANDPRLPEFIQTYRQGPQTPEPGAACTGGTGAPR